jgi:glutathione S-transferase
LVKSPESTAVAGLARGKPHEATGAGAVKAKVYGLRGSAPSFSAELMLLHKGIQYRRVNLIPMQHRKRLPAKGFPGGTVPALVLNGRRVQTNRAIARALDELVPEPPLFPAERAIRAGVEEAESFGDEVLQPATRRMILWSMSRDPDSVRPHPANGRLLVPRNAWLRRRLMPRVFEAWGITDDVVQRDFGALPLMLDKLDAYVDDGLLAGPRLNAADFQIAPLIGALCGIGDLGAEVGRRPVAALAGRVLPTW